jgi:hypothetical protein
MYYLIRCDVLLNKKGESIVEVHNHEPVGEIWSWTDGQPLEPDERNVPTPIEIEFETYDGYDGPPRELIDVGVSLMSARLADAILSAGVDNLELFPATLRNKANGATFEYRAFKLIGLVAAADLGASEASSYRGTAPYSFKKLALDEKKAHGLLMFRLAENTAALVAHERVRDAILSRGIDTLEFLKPEEWMQL